MQKHDSPKKTAKHGIGKRLRSVMVLALALVLCFAAVYKAMPERLEAEAGVFSYKTVHVQTTVDDETLQIIGAVVTQKYNQTFGITESTHELKRVGGAAIQEIIGASDSFTAALNQLAGFTDSYEPVSKISTARLLTFPKYLSFRTGAMIKLTNIVDSSAEDEAFATEVCNELIPSLNQAFLFANNGNYVPAGSNKIEKMQSYKNDLTRFLQAVAKAQSAAYATTYSYTGSDGITAKVHGAAGGDNVTIEVNGLTQEFRFQMDTDGHSDANKINWGHLAFEAFVGYYVADESLQVNIDSVYTGQASSFEELLVNLFNNLANWIKNALGLWDIDKLVFNLGGRAAPSYVGGIYPASWERTVWSLFFVSEIIAFVVLAIALLTNVLRKIMSTVNPIIRTSLIDQAKDLLIVAFALGALPLLLQLVTTASSTLTGVFGDMIAYSGPNGASESAFNERFRILSAQGGTLGGILMQFLYLAITISFNVLYIIRSYVIAILIILAPIFVVCFAMDDNKKLLAKTWMMELLSNIFIQPIHGFVLGTILLLPGSSRPVEALVMLYCVLPISSIIRSLFFGSAGASPLRTAQNGIKAFKGNAMSAWRIGSDAREAVSDFAKHHFGKQKKDKEGSGESSEAGARTEEKGASADETSLNSAAARNRAARNGGGQEISPSQQETPREKLADDIKNKGVINFENDPDAPASASDSSIDGIDLTGGALGVGAMAGVTSHGGGSDMSNVVRRTPAQDGSAQYSVSRGDMYGTGIMNLRSKRGGSEYMTTDTGFRGFNADGSYQIATGRGVYSAADAKNYADMAKVFESGTEAQKNILRKAGYDFVGAETKGGVPTGRFTVSTNKNFKDAMGYDVSARKDGGMDIQTGQNFSGEMPRTPDVGTMLNPEAYKRTMEDGSVGYTATGMALQEEAPQAGSVMPVHEGIQQPDGSYEIPMPSMENAGVSIAPADNGGVAVTYDAGIMGYDSDGAVVYNPESAMVMPDRQSVAQIQQAWEHGSDADRAQLVDQGIQSVVTQDDGRVTVTYDSKAQQAMGGQISVSNDHVIVHPNTSDTPMQTVAPVQVQPTADVAYQPDLATQVKVTPIQPSAPVKVAAPTPEPIIQETITPPAAQTVITTPPPVVAGKSTERPDIMQGTPTRDESFFVEQEKPDASKRMQRRQNAAKHDRGGKKGKRGSDWDDGYDW